MMKYSNIATINQTLKRAKAEGMNISETALRRWVKDGTLYATFSGRNALIYWPNVVKLLCGESA